jgi:hypothetical protein
VLVDAFTFRVTSLTIVEFFFAVLPLGDDVVAAQAHFRLCFNRACAFPRS